MKKKRTHRKPLKGLACYRPEPFIVSPTLPPCSNNVYYAGKVDYMMLHSRGDETEQTVQEIERKKNQMAPLYSKGAYQYITAGSDKTEIGRKI